jgi:hypothetical protein
MPPSIARGQRRWQRPQGTERRPRRSDEGPIKPRQVATDLPVVLSQDTGVVASADPSGPPLSGRIASGAHSAMRGCRQRPRVSGQSRRETVGDPTLKYRSPCSSEETAHSEQVN